MTAAQTLELRSSAIRSRLNQINGLAADAYSDEIRAESDALTSEYTDVETRHRAAMVIESDETAKRELAYQNGSTPESARATGVDRAGERWRDHHGRDGEAELSRCRAGATTGSRPGGESDPSRYASCRAAGRRRDHGADERRDQPSGDRATGLRERRRCVPGNFSPGRGPRRFGLSGFGDSTGRRWGRTATRQTCRKPIPPSIPTSWLLSAYRPAPCTVALTPHVSRTWIRRCGMALNSGLEEKLDYEALRGTEGLLTGSKLANHNKSGETTHAQYLSQFCFARVDGRFAAEQSDIKVLMGSGAYAHAGSTYQATPHLSALDALMAKVPVRVSAHVPAVASTKQNCVVRLGMRSDYVQPMWNGVTIIVDEVTGSGKGEIEVTAVLLTNTKILRASGFFKQQVAVS